VHLDQLDQSYLDDICRGAGPIEPGDRRAYFNEVIAMLGGCDAPPSHAALRNIIALAQRKFNRSIGLALPALGLACRLRIVADSSRPEPLR
jgi:hypothetical protein